MGFGGHRSFRRFSVCVFVAVLSLYARGAGPSRDLLVLDGASSQVLRVDGNSGRVLGVLVSAGSGGLAAPRAAAFGPDGALYVASSGSDQILRYNGRTGRFLGVFAGGPPLTGPTDLAFGADGALFTAVAGRILKYDPSGALAGELDPQAVARLHGSLTLTVGGDDQLYVAASESNDVLRFATSGEFVDVFVEAGYGVTGVQALRFGADGALYVASYDAAAIQRFDGDTGAYLDTFLNTKAEAGGPLAFAMSPDGDTHVVGDRGLFRYERARARMDFQLTGSPQAVAIDAVGVLAVGPDLIVASVTAPASPARGSSVVVSDTVKNQGTDAAPESTTTLYLSPNATIDTSDTLLGSRVVPALGPTLSNKGNTTVTIPAGIAAGKYNIIARADGGDAIAESNEGNNIKIKAIKIGPDLLVKTFTAPGSVQSGTTFTVADSTQNAGGEAAPPSTTRFYLSSDAKVSGTDILLGSRSVPALNPKGTSTATTTLTVPAGTAVKAWYLLAEADALKDVDESLESNNVKKLTIAIASAPPTANAGADQDVNRGASVTLDGSASSDPDGQPLTWTWTQVLGPDVTGGSGKLTGVSPTFTAPATVSTVLFDLTVSDGTYTSAPDRVQINVMEDRTQAIFIATTGNDTNPGTRSAPMLTVKAAIDRIVAAGTAADLYVAAGSYPSSQTIRIAPGVSIYGGFDPTDWARKTASVTELDVAASPAILAQSITVPTELSQLTIHGSDALASGATAYGIKVISSTALLVRSNTIVAGAGAAGSNGVSGGAGSNGAAGGPGAGGLCDTIASASGGAGGFGAMAGGGGGFGGGGAVNGGSGASGSGGTGGGTGGAYGDPGRAGTGGFAGNYGTAGVNGAGAAAGGFIPTSGVDWVAFGGSSGTSGTPGAGGGGGGGGGGQDCWFFCSSGTGNGGGGGGGGGWGGVGGAGGYGGGGSFGVALFSSTGTQVVDNVITSGSGGRGGSGGAGATGGSGGSGGVGGNVCSDQVGAGGFGGPGGAGGRGGNGGGGAGGDSYAVLLYNTSATITGTLNPGSAGAGGSGINAGAPGRTGTIQTR